MTQLTKVALLLGVFFLGCAAERLVIPPARAGTSPTRWEYLCKEPELDSTINRMANEFGAEGWELAVVDRTIWCFKRPLP